MRSLLILFLFSAATLYSAVPQFRCNFGPSDQAPELGASSGNLAGASVLLRKILDSVASGGESVNIRLIAQPNFKGLAAAAMTASGSDINRVIVINPTFFSHVSISTPTKDVLAVIALSHEVFHHINGDSLSNSHPFAAQEYNADKFAGITLKRFGASETEISSLAPSLFKEDGVSYHLSPTKRLNAIIEGFRATTVPKGGLDESATCQKLVAQFDAISKGKIPARVVSGQKNLSNQHISGMDLNLGGKKGIASESYSVEDGPNSYEVSIAFDGLSNAAGNKFLKDCFEIARSQLDVEIDIDSDRVDFTKTTKNGRKTRQVNLIGMDDKLFVAGRWYQGYIISISVSEFEE